MPARRCFPLKFVLPTLGLTLPVPLLAQLPYTEPFDSEAAAKVIPISTSNMEISYVDYSNFVVGSAPHAIAEAPHTLEGSQPTRGVLLRCVYSDSGLPRIANLLLANGPSPSNAPLTFSGNYRLKFDMYLSLSPDSTGASAENTTETGVWGIGLTEQVYDFPVSRYYRELPNDEGELGLLATYGWMTTDVGFATEDAVLRLNEAGSGTSFATALAHSDALFATAFPTASPIASAPCNQWVEVDITSLDGEVIVKYNNVEFFRSPSSQLEGYAAIGYEDPFTGSTPFAPNHQFALFDNVVVEEATVPVLEAALFEPLGTVVTGDGSASGELILTNLTSQVLEITSGTFGGEAAAEFSLTTALPLSIPAHNSRPLLFTFQPAADAANGLRSVTLTLATSSATLPSYVFAPVQARRSVAPRFQAHYKLDETSGTALADASSQNTNATLQVRDPVAFGQEGLASGTSLDLTPANASNSGNYFTTPVTHGPTFTFSAWIKPNPGADRTIFNRDPNFAGSDSIYGLVLADSGRLDFRVRSNPVAFTEDGAIVDGETYHVVVTHLDTDGFGNETADRSRLYVNGEFISAVEGIEALGFDDYPFAISPAVALLHIGSKTAAGYGYSGLIDDVQIYGIELSAEQVSGLYQNPGKNLDELETVTPIVPEPVLTAFTVDAAARKVELTWTSQTGASYRVKVSTDLSGWSDLTEEAIVATGDTTTASDDAIPETTTAKYYRVEVVTEQGRAGVSNSWSRPNPDAARAWLEAINNNPTPRATPRAPGDRSR